MKASIAVLAGLSTWSCLLSDSQLGPDVRVARLSLAPSFATVPSTVGLADVRSLRLVVERLDGSVAVDRTTELTSEDRQVELDVQVDYSPPSEVFTLEVFLMNADGDVVFTGGPMDVAVPVEDDGGAVEVPMTYVGVGSDAEFVFIAPPSAVVPEGASFTFTGRAFGPGETEIPGTPIEWESLDPTIATVPDEGSGVVQALKAGKARITATLLTGLSATAELTVTAGPILVRSPASLSFSAQERGPAPASRTLQISNGGGGTLNWSVSADQPWLTLDSVSGSSDGETDDVNVSVNIGNLTAGTYGATIALIGAPPAAGSPQTTAVTLTVAEAPFIELSPPSATLQVEYLGSSVSVPVDVTNGGGGDLSRLTAQVISYSPAYCNDGEINACWLQVSFKGSTAPATLTLTASPTGSAPSTGPWALVPGTVGAVVEVSSAVPGVPPRTLPVTFEIERQAPVPRGVERSMRSPWR